MEIIDPAMSWFEIFEVPTYNLDNIIGGNDDYIDKSYARVIQFFNNTCLNRYLLPRKVVFDNWSDFRQEFTTFIKEFDIELILTTIKNPQDNDPVKQLHQITLNIIVTKYLSNKVFDYIDPWGEKLAYIAWVIWVSHHRIIQDTPGQAVFVRYNIFNLASVVDWQVITTGKQQQVETDNVQ